MLKTTIGVTVLAIAYYQMSLTTMNDNAASNYFQNDYYEARALFRSSIRKIKNMALHSLPMTHLPDYDLTIDVGLLKRSSSKVMIHISGTHGVEGFAGSAIQAAVLDQSNITRNDPSLPTIVFVHALNPYGFANLRRWNENNVDLNRNFLSKEEFKNAREKDASGYEKIYEFLNPTKPLDYKDMFWFRSIYYIVMHSYATLKKSIVTGNYHFENSIFFGGHELQPSLEKISNFLTSKLDVNNVQELVILDIHTGLGPVRFDTLMIDATKEEAVSIFGKAVQGHIVTSHEDSGALSGYDEAIGMVNSGMLKLFPALSRKASVLQEFGTKPGIFVFKALQEEGVAFRHSPSNRIAQAQNVRDVFYLHDNPDWKNSVVTRGLIVTQQLHDWL